MNVYQAKDIRKMDKLAVKRGLSTFALMENAGRGLFEKIKPLLHMENKIAILSGRGNNGGDGIVLGRYLKQAGFHVSLVFPLGEPRTVAAKKHLLYYENEQYRIDEWDEAEKYDVIIDCLLGIGVRLPLRDDVMKIIAACNHKSALRIAVDLPTGVTADSGMVAKSVFSAHYTFGLQGMKPSAFLLPSSTFYGEMGTVSIGLTFSSDITMTSLEKVQATFPKREKATHKGTFGTGLLIAGNDEMPGSAVLAAIGAIRTGVGKLMIATTKHASSIIATTVPEATFMIDGLGRIGTGEIPEKIASAGIGPGIANESLAERALTQLMKRNIPLVVDAGALHKRERWTAKGPVILTPHPGEFSRLTGISVQEIQANRIELAKQFAVNNDVTVVLKGNATVIAFSDGRVVINSTGNSGLAKGGSGDVLTGMIVGMLATHEKFEDAVINAVFIHGCCADIWAETRSETSLVASDFSTLLPVVLKEMGMK